MLEQELQLESRLFFYLNGSDSVFWDCFFWLYSYKWTWIPFYLCFLFVFVYRKNWKEIVWVLLAVSLVILLCDQIASGFFKPFFHRFRPTHHPAFQDEVKVIFGYRGGKYGFISSHAANAFGFATFAALLFKNRLLTGTLLFFALINAYSRVYMGVHFISDVVVGALAGAIIGFFVYKLSVWSRKFLFKTDEYPLKKSLYSTGNCYFLCGAYVVIVIVLLVFNNQLVNALH
jgi:undecaprenyl-diphosphatase